jgi:uncharacterized caspase-like protein
MRRTAKQSFLSLLMILICAAGTLGTASGQEPEKRIALVVGNGAYAKSPLATAANDAGLIGQTLQAAGFDVIGARDLDGDTLRKSFRDFIQKAQSSGPGTVAMVYLAGYGVQIAGENYFIPVDSSINRDTDVPTEALRVSDYLRQLAAVPLKASIIVLDAGRQQPFIEGDPPIASGLALVEPEPNMLIAFNAAPGTVAPGEPGPYGAYAQSLAEMIRTGGLPLPEVFNRVRLRVNDATKGAQVPWDAEKMQAQFSFFERASDAPPVEGTPDQMAAIRAKSIRDLGAREAYTAALERDTLPAYEEFLAAYPDDPMARRVRAIVAARREAITWGRTYRADTPEAYWSYLRRYPHGPHAGDARRRLAILTAPLEPPPSFAMMAYDVPPPPPDEIIYVDRPVLMFSDPDFGFAPPPPPPIYYLPPPPPDFVVLPPPIAPIGLFLLPQPVFVPIPLFVRPPVYVAPPPNNIIFNNIHNTTVINTVINRPPPPIAAGPGGQPAAIALRTAPAGPAVPPAVAQRATLIQQGRLPVPPSASINAARTGVSPAPANVTPANAPSATAPSGQPGSPRGNALPVPGAGGTPPAPSAAAPSGRPGSPRGNTLPVPSAGRTPPVPSAAAPAVPSARLTSPPAPAGTTPPARANLPTAAPPKPPVAVQTPSTAAPVVNDRASRGGGPVSAPLSAPAAGKPSVTATRPSAPPVSAARPQLRPEAPRISSPPARSQAANPPPAAGAPRPQTMARPTPPPPPQRAAPPPVARPAPPPVAAARPAPSTPPRAAASPPRPAPAAAAAKKCPPNVPRC